MESAYKVSVVAAGSYSWEMVLEDTEIDFAADSRWDAVDARRCHDNTLAPP